MVSFRETRRHKEHKHSTRWKRSWKMIQSLLGQICYSSKTRNIRRTQPKVYKFLKQITKNIKERGNIQGNVKVKVTLVQALRLCTGRTAHRRNRGIALPFLDHGTRRWWGVSVTPRPLFTPGKDPVPIVQEAGWDPGTVWTSAENLASHRDSIPGPSSP